MMAGCDTLALMSAIAARRLAAIRRELALWGAVQTTDLARQMAVSERTIQRDLAKLADDPAVEKVHGGLVMADPPNNNPSLRIGMLVPIGEYYFAEITAGALEAATALNVQLVVGDYSYREDLESAALNRLEALRLDGLVATVSSGYEQLMSLDLPVVVVERPLHPTRLRAASAGDRRHQVDHVCSDHQAGAAIGLRHLVDLGHRSLICVVRRTATSVALLRGLRQTIEEFDDDCSVAVHEVSARHGQPRSSAALDAEVLDQVIARCRDGTATGIFVHADWEARDIHHRLTSAGIDVPDRVSIIAYDGVLTGQPPALSAVTPQRRWLGIMAVEAVVDRLRSAGQRSHSARPGYQLSLLPELVLRSSTGPPPGH